MREESASSASVMPARIRIISPSAPKVTPSPYEAERPWCQKTVSASPSTYFKNSHASRLLPMPGSPVIDTNRARRSRAVACRRSFTRRNSSSRPTKGGSKRSLRPRPLRLPTTRRALQALTISFLPFKVSSPASSKAIAPEVARHVASSTSTVPGVAALWTREAELTVSPSTMPSATLPMVTATSPVTTPPRASSPSRPASRPSAGTNETISNAARTARSASSSFAVGAPQTAITASPMNFSTVPP